MDLLVTILIIELLVLLFCFASMVFVRFSRNFWEKQTNKHRKELKEIFVRSIEKQQVLTIEEIPSRLIHYEDILSVLETFDRYFLDSIWLETKKCIIEGFLAKKAASYTKSSNWRKRQLGLRCIALNPKHLIGNQNIVPFLNDSKFIIRILAASVLIHAEQKDLLLAVLKRMVQEAPMARYAYRDLLINGSYTTFQWMEEIADEEKDSKIIAACLGILSTKMRHNLLPLAIKQIRSTDLFCRLASIEIFSKTPSIASQKYLIESLSDINPQIRSQAALGLGLIHALPSIANLSLALQDTEWNVRLQAANALKSMGKEGKEELYKQSQAQNAQAFEIAKYILSLP